MSDNELLSKLASDLANKVIAVRDNPDKSAKVWEGAIELTNSLKVLYPNLNRYLFLGYITDKLNCALMEDGALNLLCD